MNGRKALLVIILLMLALMGLSFRFSGYETTWHLWNIPTLMPPFTDLRLLPGSAESYRAGFNPIHNNPGDPLGRHFNYPFAWYFVFYTGIKQDDTIWIGALLTFGYLLCTWMLSHRIGVPSACLIAIILFSPASMLAVERGNVDLFIFILCTLTLLFLENRPWLATGILMVASFLKLFPIFGLAIFLREDRSRFWVISLSAFAIFVVYAGLTYSNISASFAYTEKGSELSYGVNVIPLYMEQLFRSKQLFDLLTPIFALIGLGLSLFVFYLGSQSDSLRVNESRHLSAFRLGAMIYVGTFSIGNNWDYRLIFLLFAVPQLVEWAIEPPARKPARWTIVSLVIACWYLINLYIFGFFPMGEYIVYLLDQISKWGLFAGLCYFFLASAPDWLKMEIKKAFEFRKQKPA
jgi:hypothetical protein